MSVEVSVLLRGPGHDRPKTGVDSLIAVPKTPDEPLRFTEGQLQRLAEQQAANLGEVLHSARFQLTDNPAVVEATGVLHDCETCRIATYTALRWMREHPGKRVLVGELWWAEP